MLSPVQTGNKVDRIGNSRLYADLLLAGYGISHLSTKSTVLNSTL